MYLGTLEEKNLAFPIQMLEESAFDQVRLVDDIPSKKFEKIK